MPGSDNDPDRSKAMPLFIRYEEAAVVLELDEWIAIYEILDSLKDHPEIESEDEKQFVDRMLDKISHWIQNSGFKNFPAGYRESDKDPEDEPHWGPVL